MRTAAVIVAVLSMGGAATAGAPPDASKPPAAAEPPVERISQLQRTLADEERQLRALRDSLDDPASEYRAAEAEFKEIDAQVERKTREVKRLTDRQETAAAEKAAKELEALREPRERAAKRFAAAVTERKLLQEKIAALEGRLAEEQEELDRLLGIDAQGKIVRLRQQVESEEAELKKVRDEVAAGADAHLRLEEAWKADETAFRTKLAALQELRQNPDAKGIPEAQAAVKEAADKAFESKKAFDRSTQRRTALQDKIAGLEKRIARGKAEIERLSALAAAPKADPKTAPPTTGNPPPAAKTNGSGSPPPATSGGAQPGTGTPPPTDPGSVAGAALGPNAANPEPAKVPSVREKAARKDAETKREAARKAEEALGSINKRIDDLRKLISAERALLATNRTKLNIAVEDRDAAAQELVKLITAGAPDPDIRAQRDKAEEAGKRVLEARAAVNRSNDQLEKLHDELQVLQGEQIRALREAEDRRREADDAEKAVERINSPFDPINIITFAAERGPRILIVLLVMVGFSRLAGKGSQKIVQFMIRNGEPETLPEREARARTMVGVFHNAAGVAILLGGSLMILDELGVNVALLMGGAAVVGLAVAFGAQNLVRDYFSGFVILLENQYMVNDVVKFGNLNLAGLVERITLRLTVLRDIDGVVHFVPNGQIVTVTNMTHEYSRALFDIPVGHREDIDKVIDVLRSITAEMRKDPYWGYVMLADMEMLGVERITELAVYIRFFIKTRPIKQWDVMRETNKRILRRFRELGIEIPVPQRVITVRGLPEGGSRLGEGAAGLLGDPHGERLRPPGM